MEQPSTVDERVRLWNLQRQLVRASLSSGARGHVLAPPRASGPAVTAHAAVAAPAAVTARAAMAGPRGPQAHHASR